MPREDPRQRGRWPWLRPLGWTLVAVGVAGGFALAVMLVSTEQPVGARLEATQYRAPSRGNSAPSIPYPGLGWRRFGLKDTLLRLGYREASSSKDLPPGQYVWEGSRVRVLLRAFEHPTRPEPAR